MTLGRALEISEEQVEALKGDYMAADCFSDAEKAAIRWAEVMTLKQYHGEPGRRSQSEAAMAALKEHYDEAQIVEISVVSGFFNFWNRFTDSLQIDIEADPVMHLIQRSAKVDPEAYVAFMRDCWWSRD